MDEKIYEVYTYEAFTGQRFTIKINYLHNQVTFLEGTNEGAKAKQFIFANRGIEYMNGWLQILEAMKEATKDAQARLEAHQKQKNDTTTEVLIKATELVAKQKIKRLKK